MLTLKILNNEILPIQITPLIDTCTLLDIDDSIYFGPQYTNYVSNSRLGLINPAQGGSLQKYNEGFNLYSDSLVLGSALHELVLQPEDYILCESVNRPQALLGYVADECYLASNGSGKMVSEETVSNCAQKIGYYQGQVSKFSKFLPTIEEYIKLRASYEKGLTTSKHPIFLSEKQRDSLNGCLQSFTFNPGIQALLNDKGDDSGCERTILLSVRCDFPEGESIILNLKSKIDHYSVDKAMGVITVNDVKTTSRPCTKFNDAFYGFHYYREFAMYSFMLSSLMKKEGMSAASIFGNCLVVETASDEHASTVFPVTPTMFQQGIKEFSILLKMVAYYTKHGFIQR